MNTTDIAQNAVQASEALKNASVAAQNAAVNAKQAVEAASTKVAESGVIERAGDAVNTILLKTIDLATKTGDFVVDQTSDLIHQLIMFNIAKTSLILTFCIAVIVVYLFMLKWARSQPMLDSYSGKQPGVAACFVYFLGTAVAAFFTWFFAYEAIELLKLTLAPKLWLLEYAADLYRSMNR